MFDECHLLLFDSNSSEVVYHACIQSITTIRAAEIASAAEIRAAYILGLLTLLAGSFAVLAGFLAYRGSIRQSRLEESKHKDKKLAYKFRISRLVADLIPETSANAGIAEDSLKKFNEIGGSFQFHVPQYFVPEELKPNNWLEHSLLGKKAVPLLSRLHVRLDEAARFGKEMHGKKSDDTSSFPSISTGNEQPDGGTNYEFDFAVVQNFKIQEALLSALVELSNELDIDWNQHIDDW